MKNQITKREVGYPKICMDKKYYDAFESNDGRLKTIVTSYKDN